MPLVLKDDTNNEAQHSSMMANAGCAGNLARSVDELSADSQTWKLQAIESDQVICVSGNNKSIIK